jgi:hypothetical protein
MSAATFTQTAHIPNTKYGFSGRPQQGYDQYEISFSGLGEFGLPYTKTFTFRVTLDGAYFAIAGRDWTSRSFDELLKNYNAGSSAVRSFSTQTMLFDFVVFTDDEIKQARKMWAEEKGIPFVEDEPVVVAVAAPVEEPVVAPVDAVPEVEDASDSKYEAEIDFEEQPVAVEEEPAFCTPQMLRDAESYIRRLTKNIYSCENNERKFLERKLKSEEALLLAQSNPRANNRYHDRLRQKIADAELQLAAVREELAAIVRERDSALRRKQHLQTLPLGQPLSSESAPQPVLRSKASSVTIRMLSGDLVEIEIDMDQPIIRLMEEFIRQRRFNPSAGKRLVFIVDGEDEPLIAYDRSDERVNSKWSEVFSESLPLLHLLIQAPNERPSDVHDKVCLIREIGEKQKRISDSSDEEIYSLYSEWILTYVPPAKSNRYTTMSAFVEQHLHLFPQLDDQAFYAHQAEKEYRKLLADFRDFRDRDAASAEDRIQQLAEYYQSTPEHILLMQAQYQRNLQHLLEVDPDYVFSQHDNHHYRHWFTIMELLAFGVRPRHICSCTRPRCFIGNWERLSADLAEAELNGIPLPKSR